MRVVGLLSAAVLAASLVQTLAPAHDEPVAPASPAAMRRVPEPARPRVAPPTPCRVAAPTTAAGYNALLGRVEGWQAGDGGHTTMLDNGRRAWSFGDSLLGDNRLYHSALVIQDQGCAKSVNSNADLLPAALCGDNPATPAEEGYCWAGPIAYQAGRLYMLAPQMVRPDGCEGTWCFTGVGVRLFVWRVPARSTPVLESSTLLPVVGSVFWASALMLSTDGVLAYVYGQRDDGNEWTFGTDTYLAVVPLAGLTNTANWLYRTASGWSPSAAAARPILAAAGGPESSVSVRSVGASVVLTSTADGGLGHLVTEWVSGSPWGPWTTRSVADYPDTAEAFKGDPKAHLWYLPFHVAGTSLHVISQNWPNRPLSDIVGFPADFRVRVF